MLTHIEVKKMEKKKFDLLEEDIYEAEVLDVKEVEDIYNDETQEKIEFTFSILDEKYKGRRLWRKVNPWISDGKMSPRVSELYKILCALDSLDWGAKETSAEDINKLIGKKCRIVVKKETSKKGNEYNKITDVLKSKLDKAVEVDDKEITPDMF
jgi:hypothetical protein